MKDIQILRNILLNENVEQSIKENEEIIFHIIPLLKEEKGFEQKSEWHCYDVWNHTIKAITTCDENFKDRLILLLHDIGKPFSYQDDGDIRHFRGHAEKSAELSKIILENLVINEKDKNEMLFIIRNHSKKIENLHISNNPRLFCRLLKIQMCDASAYEPKHAKMILEKLNSIEKEFKKNDVER